MLIWTIDVSAILLNNKNLMNQKKIVELITKMTFSRIPPSLQEHVIDNVAKISEEHLDKLVAALDELADKEADYFGQAQQYLVFYENLAQDIQSKQIAEARKIQKELLEELKTAKEEGQTEDERRKMEADLLS